MSLNSMPSLMEQIRTLNHPNIASPNINSNTFIMRFDTPQFVTMFIGFISTWVVFTTAGVGVGVLSAVLTCVCVCPLFAISSRDEDEEEFGDNLGHTHGFGYGGTDDYHNIEEIGREDLRSPLTVAEGPNNSSADELAEEFQTQQLANQMDPSHPLQIEHNTNQRNNYRIHYSIIDRFTNYCIDDIEEMMYIFEILRENQGLLLLLMGGITSLMMALLAGLESANYAIDVNNSAHSLDADVKVAGSSGTHAHCSSTMQNIPKALFLSVTCYFVTTLLVAKSARRVVYQERERYADSIAGGRGCKNERLTWKDIVRLMDNVPEEDFVFEEDLNGCDLKCIRQMIQNRIDSRTSQQQNQQGEQERAEPNEKELYSTLIDSCGSKVDQLDKTMLAIEITGNKNENDERRRLLTQIRQRRNYNESCCICLSTFQIKDRIRVLPQCHHEFHKSCIDQWAGTFASRKGLNSFGGSPTRDRMGGKKGRPTCPLCNTCFGCLPEIGGVG